MYLQSPAQLNAIMEKFSLKWNDFHSNVSKSFGLFRSEEYLHDVRLMTEDFYEVSAHRLVLSACSEYFRNIFKNSKKQDTLICLDGVTSEDIKNVLDYIYLGEAQIYQDQLDRFLSVAEKLKLEGLLSQGEEETKHEENISSSQQTPFENEKFIMDQIIVNDTSDRQVPERSSRKMVRTNESMTDHSELDSKILEYGERVDGGRKCNACNKIVPGKGTTNFRNHVEVNHMEGLSFDCQHCDITFRSRGALHNHKSKYHK